MIIRREMGPSILHSQCGCVASDRDPLSSPVMWHWLLGRFVCSTVLGSRPAPAPCRAAACRWPSPNGPRNPGPAAATTAVAADLKPGPKALGIMPQRPSRQGAFPVAGPGAILARRPGTRPGPGRQAGPEWARPGRTPKATWCFNEAPGSALQLEVLVFSRGGTCERSGALAHHSDSESSATT